MKTIKVKILIATDDEGKWSSAGYCDDMNPREWICLDNLSESVTFHWVEAEVPAPEPQTIQGNVSNVEDSK